MENPGLVDGYIVCTEKHIYIYTHDTYDSDRYIYVLVRISNVIDTYKSYVHNHLYDYSLDLTHANNPNTQLLEEALHHLQSCDIGEFSQVGARTS